MEPTPLRPPHNRRQFLLGLRLGAIPLVVWLIFLGWATADVVGCRGQEVNNCWFAGIPQIIVGLIVFGILWLLMAAVTIASLARKSRRFEGYGVLVMQFLGPMIVIASINFVYAIRNAG